MHAGQIIQYKITVLPFIRMRWKTEITEVSELISFTDVQRKGPYSYWSHKHSFTKIENGVEMTDELEYALPMGLLGRLTHLLFVGQEVKDIFEYRFQVLGQHFTKKS
jgi:ligand-binding SRPBCC domain-containing protein